MTQYFLPRHVHFCFSGDSTVFLDLRRDDYMLASSHVARALHAAFVADDAEETTTCAEALEEVVQRGLLTTDANSGRRAAPTMVERANTALVDTEALAGVRLTFLHIWRFVIASVSAMIMLRWYRLENTVNAIERRKFRHARASHMNIDKARELTAAFTKLRPLLPRSYLCLFDSLALLEFLASYHVFPTWVFGIRLSPWAAHCWVQQDCFTFDEDAEEAASYTPVMAI